MPISKVKVHHQIEQNKTFSMIPHSLHDNKEYIWSYDEKYDIFLIIFCFFSRFIRKFLKLINIDTVEPRYNEVLGTMKITLLYQVSHYIRVKKLRNIKS